MDKQNILIMIGILAAVALIVTIILIRNGRKTKMKKQINDLNVRFNAIKTVPLAFKLSKAQAMAKRNEETSAQVKDYYSRYEEAEKHIGQIQEMLNSIDDCVSSREYKEARESIKVVEENIADSEKEVNDIDIFLNEFSKKENEQREYSSKLKEKYRVVKTTINNNSNMLSIAFGGFEKKLKDIEDRFSRSEDLMYANEYADAQIELEGIDNDLDDIKVNANKVPSLVKDTKGVLPLMIDEAKREYALTRQRGVYLDHLNADDKFKQIDDELAEDIKSLAEAEAGEVKDHVANAKDTINNLMEDFAAENRSFKEAKETNDQTYEHIMELERVENYVRVAYDKDSERFGLEDLKPILKKQRDDIEKYHQRYLEINEELANMNKPASSILSEAEEFAGIIDGDLKNLYSYKMIIDKSTDGETRALSQLTKLQLVVSEVESKIAEYRLPTISSGYEDDLKKSRGYIAKIREMTGAIPIDIDELNAVLNEAIDFIYKFYNNVNNIVGMAIMVENAIVFGNKYRSTYVDIDRELSKAEFQFLNGEYTKALKTAITCMETLFPDNADEKILENS